MNKDKQETMIVFGVGMFFATFLITTLQLIMDNKNPVWAIPLSAIPIILGISIFYLYDKYEKKVFNYRFS